MKPSSPRASAHAATPAITINIMNDASMSDALPPEAGLVISMSSCSDAEGAPPPVTINERLTRSDTSPVPCIVSSKVAPLASGIVAIEDMRRARTRPTGARTRPTSRRPV